MQNHKVDRKTQLIDQPDRSINQKQRGVVERERVWKEIYKYVTSEFRDG